MSNAASPRDFGFDSSGVVRVVGDKYDGYTRLIRDIDAEPFVFDTALSLSGDCGDILSEHPGESVQAVADNAQSRGSTWSLVVVVGNTAPNDFPDQTENRVQACQDFLEASRHMAMTLRIPQLSLSNLVIERWAPVYGLDDSMTFSIDFRQVRVGDATQVDAIPLKPAPRARALDKKADDGVQEGEPADPPGELTSTLGYLY